MADPQWQDVNEWRRMQTELRILEALSEVTSAGATPRNFSIILKETGLSRSVLANRLDCLHDEGFLGSDASGYVLTERGAEHRDALRGLFKQEGTIFDPPLVQAFRYERVGDALRVIGTVKVQTRRPLTPEDAAALIREDGLDAKRIATSLSVSFLAL